MDTPSLTKALKEKAHQLGFQLAGACRAISPPGIDRFRQWLLDGFAGQMSYLVDRSDAYEHPCSVLPNVRGILMLGFGYRTAVPLPTHAGQGRVARYAWAADYHDLLHARLKELVRYHRELVPSANVRGVVDTAPLLEREFGQLAGLGWIGKNTLLLNRSLGSWFFLSALLTTEKLQYDAPEEHNYCGTCRACIEACPTGALVDAYRLDARKCISYLTIEQRNSLPTTSRELTGDWLLGCDICQEVCPWNHRAPVSTETSFQPPAEMNPVELESLFNLDEEAFRKRFRRTPLWRPRRRGLLRNAALVFGNCPTPTTVPPLCRGLNDPEPLVRAASAWALGKQTGETARTTLAKRLRIEQETEVRHEIEEALAFLPPL